MSLVRSLSEPLRARRRRRCPAPVWCETRTAIVVWSSGPLRVPKLVAAAVLRASCRQACLPELDFPRCVATQRLVHSLFDWQLRRG